MEDLRKVIIVIGSCCSYCSFLGYDWCGCLEPSALGVIVYLDIRYKI